MILVCGVPRSGTTWIGKILSQADGITYYHEPDNEHHNLLGYIHKQNVRRFPYLTKDDPKNGMFEIYKKVLQGKYMSGYTKSNLLIKKLLDINLDNVEEEIETKSQALNAAHDPSYAPPIKNQVQKKVADSLYSLLTRLQQENLSDRRVLVKSVHCILALPYLEKFFKQDTVLVLRHPANIVSSHMKLGNPDIRRAIFKQEPLVQDYFTDYKEELDALEHPLEKAGAQVAAFYHVLNQHQDASRFDWITIKHEDFCLEPAARFKNLFDQLDLDWSEDVQQKISELNKDGDGYAYKRVAEKQIDKWKRRLAQDQIKHIKRGYSTLPTPFYQEFTL